MKWLYVAFNLFILIPCLFISYKLKINTHSNKRQFVVAYAFVSLPFILWDIFATSRGHWSFAEKYTLGVKLFGLPIEEIAFFFTVPFGCMLVWDALKVVKTKFRLERSMILLVGLWLLTSMVLVFGLGREYTQIVTSIVLLTIGMLFWKGKYLLSQKRFWQYQIICLSLFVVFNMYLTAIPIVSYGAAYNLGIRFVTIPLEDFFFNFALLNLFLLAYTYTKQRA